MNMPKVPPKVFISYSHDTEAHKNWVLTLATRLVANGVDVVLDQWDLTLGSDLPRFMESGLTEAHRIITICTQSYVAKANSGVRGVGYEKMILTAQLMQDMSSDRIIPVVRDNDLTPPVPTFLSSRVYIDFCDDLSYEARYAELLRDIHGERIKPRPALGQNPFIAYPAVQPPLISFGAERYVSPAVSGEVTFDYSNNNGRFVLGAGDMAFETAWSRGGSTSIHAYNDPPSIRSVALALDVRDISEIVDASKYDISSRTRSPHLGEIVIWQNSTGYYLATRIESLKSRGHGSPFDEITFTYAIAPSKSCSFSFTK
ncbi:toll/interleukin-1 receptor domain-containing protein [Pseudomonas yamanorum]|nr:toll/interleukin-1 receptor domain-containing protein [Pseudomonas yamanorum]